MAIYHLHLQIVTRGAGKSAVAAAAYRSGEKLTNEYDGEIHDFTRKSGVVHTEIITPDHAPREFAERSVLWNAVEKAENQRNSQLAREINLALPCELTEEQNITLVREYTRRNFVSAGMCADIAIHDPDHDVANPHAHIMLTMRPLNLDGGWGQKVRKVNGKRVYTTDWNDRGKAEQWRAAWADAVNKELARRGFRNYIDHRSYERQGVDKIPAVHLGAAATQMERRGIATDRGDLNREIEFTNLQIRQLRARMGKVKAWLDETNAKTPPTLYDAFTELINSRVGDRLSDHIRHLKLTAKTLLFIQQNDIRDLPALADKVGAMQRDCNAAFEQKEKAERRVKTLGKHIEQSEIFKKYRKFKAKYDALYADYKAAEKSGGLFAKSKAQKALDAANDFYDAHRSELAQFETAEKYLKDVLQSRFDPKKLPPIKKWNDEREARKRELAGINSEYAALKSEVESAETIKRFAVKLMLPDEPQEQQQKTKTLEVEI